MTDFEHTRQGGAPADNHMSNAVDALLSDALPVKDTAVGPSASANVHSQLSLGPGIDGMMEFCNLDGALGSGAPLSTSYTYPIYTLIYTPIYRSPGLQP